MDEYMTELVVFYLVNYLAIVILSYPSVFHLATYPVGAAGVCIAH